MLKTKFREEESSTDKKLRDSGGRERLHHKPSVTENCYTHGQTVEAWAESERAVQLASPVESQRQD